MIGLGGGALLMSLIYDNPTLSVTAVELSSDVLEVAKSAFGLEQAQEKLPGRLELVHGDGLLVLSSMQGTSYDGIIVDCFVGKGEVPESCRSKVFADEVVRVLRPGGILLQTMWSFSWESGRVADDFKATTALYSSAFGSGFHVTRVPMPPEFDFVHILNAEKSSP